ncbi:MAG: hypothetical protein ACJAUP_002492 [Cellvibrionaceae bacterium]|jgi:hypothetical protein
MAALKPTSTIFMNTSKLYILYLMFSPSIAIASSINLDEGVFEFNGVATLAIIAGIYCIYLGFKLISNGTSKGEIKIDMEVPEKGKLTVSGATSGVAFMIFGALIVVAGALGNIAW